MRRVFLGILATAAALSLGAITAMAAGPGIARCFARGGACTPASTACIHADANGDGFCDRCAAVHPTAAPCAACGGSFLDADGDGLCDNCAAAAATANRGYGHHAFGHGRRGGHGCHRRSA